jgi:hypothetical protein
MGIMNRRNALLGWAVWKVAASVAKKKAKRAVPTSGGGRSGWLRRGAVVGLGFAAATGAVAFWRKKNDDTPPVV